jgi:hypothetical protein
MKSDDAARAGASDEGCQEGASGEHFQRTTSETCDMRVESKIHIQEGTLRFCFASPRSAHMRSAAKTVVPWLVWLSPPHARRCLRVSCRTILVPSILASTIKGAFADQATPTDPATALRWLRDPARSARQDGQTGGYAFGFAWE